MKRWDGNYFVYLILRDGQVVRQNAWKPLPREGCTVAGSDNGMQGRAYYAKQKREIREAEARRRAN